MKITSRFVAGIAIATLAAIGLSACAPTGNPSSSPSAGLTVYATTGYLADAVANIAPDAKVTTMVGPGGDPHTYQPSTKDIEAIQDADVVFWNGLHLEAQMIDQLESLGSRQLAVGDQLPEELLLDWPETDDAGNPLHDPHVWNSPAAWTLVVGYLAEKLAEVDPDNAEVYRTNGQAYADKITAAAADATKLLASLPEPRVLITGHDAFNYFGQTFGLEVHATDFVSTEAKLSAGELSELARLIADKRVPVIFLDNQTNPQAITSLKEAVHALGWDVEVSDKELFADSLGTEAPLDTYLGAFSHNVQVVAESLGGTGR